MGTLASGAALSALPRPASAETRAKPVICVFSKHLHWLEIPDMAQTARELGFAGIDLTVRPGGHVEPEKVATELPKAVSLIRKAGLQVPMITTNVMDPDSPLSHAVLKAAGELEIPYYRTGYLKYDPNLEITQNLEQFRTQMQKLAALNKKYRIHGAYQNHSGTGFGAAVWDLWEVLKDLDPQWIGCQYDIKHAVAEGGLSWVHGLNALKSHIRCMDIKDFIWVSKGGKWQQEQMPLGTGMVDFGQYFRLLKKYAISGPMSLHYEYSLGGAEHGKKTLSVPREEVLQAIQRDLRTLRRLLDES